MRAKPQALVKVTNALQNQLLSTEDNSQTPPPLSPRCMKAAFVNVASLTWKLTAACLASSPPTAGHCFFFLFFLSHHC